MVNKRVIILLLVLLAFASFVNSVGYVEQETANSTVNSTVGECPNCWKGNSVLNLTDGDWSNHAYATSATAWININYTKPSWAGPETLWQVKYGTFFATDTTNNSLPLPCWNAFSDTVSLRATSTNGGTAQFYCWNTSEWHNVGATGSSYIIYEESIHWAQPSQNFSLILNEPLNNSEINNTNIEFNFTSTFEGLNPLNCSLWTNSSGTWEINDTIWNNEKDFNYLANDSNYTSECTPWDSFLDGNWDTYCDSTFSTFPQYYFRVNYTKPSWARDSTWTIRYNSDNSGTIGAIKCYTDESTLSSNIVMMTDSGIGGAPTNLSVDIPANCNDNSNGQVVIYVYGFYQSLDLYDAQINWLHTNISNNTKINFSSLSLNAGEYIWNVECYDNESNSYFADSNQSLIIGDIAPPTFDQALVDKSFENHTNFVYEINATDASGVSEYNINESTYFLINSSGYLQNQTNVPVGTYSINLTLNDTYNNILWGILNVTVTDGVAPNISPGLADKTYQNHTNFIYDVNGTDNVAITDWSINESTYFSIDSSGIITNQTNVPIAVYSINVSPQDAAGNRDWGILNITVSDGLAPSFSPVLTNQEYSNITNLVYDINASDNVALDTWKINDSNFTISGAGIITNTTNILIGTHSVNVTVNDTSNNILWGIVNISTYYNNVIINLNEPADNTERNESRTVFNATAVHSNNLLVENCSLWTNSSGSWTLNKTLISIANNTKFSFPAVTSTNGEYIWNIQCFDNESTSYWAASNYTLYIGARTMTINLNEPAANVELNQSTFVFNFTTVFTKNLEIANCSLEGNFTGTWATNQTNISVVSNNTKFSFSSFEIPTGEYIWNTRCYDNYTETYVASSNRSLTVVRPILDIGLINPYDNAELGSNFTFNFTYNETKLSVENCSLWTNSTGSWALNQTNVTGLENNTLISFSEEFFTKGSYIWNIQCIDTDGNEWWAPSNRTFDKNNTVPLVASLSIQPSPAGATDNLTAVNITSDEDGDTISAYYIKWYNDTIEVPELENKSFVATGNTSVDQDWKVSMAVFDGFEWSNFTNSTTITLGDTEPPILGNASLSASSGNNDAPFTIYVNATEENTLAYVRVQITDPNSIATNFSMTPGNVNGNQSKVYTPSTDGNYTFKFFASDGSGNIVELNSTLKYVESTVEGGGGGGGGGGGSRPVNLTQLANESGFIIEGDGICSPGERQDSPDCRGVFNIDDLVRAIFDPAARARLLEEGGLVFVILVFLGAAAIYSSLEVQTGGKRRK